MFRFEQPPTIITLAKSTLLLLLLLLLQKVSHITTSKQFIAKKKVGAIEKGFTDAFYDIEVHHFFSEVVPSFGSSKTFLTKTLFGEKK